MRESILFSKTIRNILMVFVTNPRQSFYLRQLSALTGNAPRPVQLALQKLEKAGILTSFRQANLKFYSLNKNSPIYAEIKNIILKTDAIDESVRKSIKNLKNLQCAFIYGASTKEKTDAKLQLCFIGDVDSDTLSKTIVHIKEKLKRSIATSIFTPQEWKKALENKEQSVVNMLNDKKILLVGRLDTV